MFASAANRRSTAAAVSGSFDRNSTNALRRSASGKSASSSKMAAIRRKKSFSGDHCDDEEEEGTAIRSARLSFFHMAGEITQLLQRWNSQQQQPDSEVQAQLAPLVYDHLRQVARAFVSREYGANDLNATGLVHELFLRLIDVKGVDWQDRAHFYTFAARMMRNILVDEARRRNASKRGSGDRVPLAGDLAWVDASSEEMLDVHAAFEELMARMPDAARAVELRVFLGCTAEEAASILGIGKATVDRQMRFARAWLYDRLRGPGSATTTPD